MESNPYKNYYSNQAGSGIGGFQGVHFQRGAGFFGNVYKNAILPLLKYFGKQAINTGAKVAEDAISGQNVLESMKSRGKLAARSIASDAAQRINKFAQTGTGRRGRRKRSKIPVFIQKRKRTTRRKASKKSKRSRKSVKKHSLNSIFNV